jgi:hypothetical protein
MANGWNLCVVVGIVMLIAFFIFMGTKESYANIGQIDNIGSVEDGYELVQSPEDHVPEAQFADLVDSGNEQAAILPQKAQRIVDVQGAPLLPRISKGVTPYNVDVADPVTHSFMVNPPNVQLKDPLKMLADPYRGDIPIKYYPNVPLVNQSRYGRDSLRLDGFFSDAFRDLYNKYSGKGYKNLPMSVVNEETIMDA